MDNSSKILRLLKSKEKTIIDNIKRIINSNTPKSDILQFIIDDAHEYVHAAGLQSIPSKGTSDWRKEQSKYYDLIKNWAKTIMKKINLKNEDLLKSKLQIIIKEELQNLVEEKYEHSSLSQIRLHNINDECENILDELRDKLDYLNNKKKLTKDPDVDKDIKFWNYIKKEITTMYNNSQQLYNKIDVHLKRKVLKLGK